MRRLSVVALLAAALVALPAGAALAHECIVVNRSATGGEKAAASGKWLNITTDDIIVFITGDPSLVPVLSEAYREAVIEAGLPTEFAIFMQRLLGSKGPDQETLTPGYMELGHSNDGKGVDHVFSGGYADEYAAILFGLLGG